MATVIRWDNGTRQVYDNVTPTPFGVDRAKEIEALARQRARQFGEYRPWRRLIFRCMTCGEEAYIDAVVAKQSTQDEFRTNAFLSILNKGEPQQ